MRNIFWDKPVVAGDKLIFGPLEARRFLQSEWPHSKSIAYAAADLCVLKALDGRATPDEARELFEIALRSAELVLPGTMKLAS